MKFQIELASNGIIVIDDENEKHVFNIDGDEETEVTAFANFLRFLDNDFGPSTSRYAEHRIYVAVGPGDKNDNYKCPFCGSNDGNI